MGGNSAALGFQWSIAALFAVILLRYALVFRWKLYRFASGHLGLSLILALLYALVYAQLGTDLGIHYLFWHEDFWARVSAALGAALVLGVLGVIAYYLDPYPWATEQETRAWLRVDEYLKHKVASWWSRRVNTPLRLAWWWVSSRVHRQIGSRTSPIRPQPLPRPGPIVPPPTAFEVAFFWVHNVALDLISVSPFQLLFEPRGNQLRLQRFLRTCRVPFLLLLMAPALLPGLVQVPRVAPTGRLGWEKPPVLDVGRMAEHPSGYLLGVAAWLLGIAAGVAAIKVLIAASEGFHPVRVGRSRPLAATQPVVGRPAWVRSHPGCPQAASCATGGCPRGEPEPGGRPPSGCLARRQALYSILVFFGIVFAVYVAMARIPVVYNEWISPAFAICATLGILAMAVAMLEFLPRWFQLHFPAAGVWPRMVQLPMVLLLVVWLGFANNAPYKYRFEGMLYDEAKLVELRDRVDKVYFEDGPPPDADGPVQLVADDDARAGWEKNTRPGDADLDPDGRPKLVLVAVSGGAARSAYWTAVVLDRLERSLPTFGRRVRIISGASGGMLGTAYYVKYRRDAAADPSLEPGPGSGSGPSPWVERVPFHSMEPLAKHIALSEIWRALWPGFQGDDRGVVLERDWVELRVPFRSLSGREREGKIPSLIFSPMMIEDGRRLLISNLDLASGPDADPDAGRFATSIVKARGRRLSRTPPLGTVEDLGTDLSDYSLSGMEFFRIFPESQCLLLSTAVRMSATFPYVSPAVNLPTIPPRRVVDAGYYDNYGVQVAVAWIRQHRAWLAEHTSGVLLVQVRDSASERERLDVDDSTPGPLSWGNASRGYQFLTSPIDGFQTARYTSTSFRNDDDIEGLSLMFAGMMDEKLKRPDSFFATAIFENSAVVTLDDRPFWEELDDLTKVDDSRPVRDHVNDVTMTWNLTRAEREATRRAIPEAPPSSSRWHSAAARAHAQDLLAGQVFATMSRTELARRAEQARKPVESLRAELQGKGDISFPPGPGRDLRFKRLEQLRNYAQLENLAIWWKESGKRKSGPLKGGLKSD